MKHAALLFNEGRNIICK